MFEKQPQNFSNLGDFNNKNVVVTGGAQGIGAEIILQMHQRGANITAVDIDIDGMQNHFSDLERVTCYQVDLTSEEDVNEFWHQYQLTGHRLDILVNSAGGVAKQEHKGLEQVTLSDWQTLIDINLTSSFLMCRGAVTVMGDGGRIINISSGAGRSVSLTGIQGYASAKAGQLGLTRQLAYELGPKGITVNAIAPGLVLSNPTSCKQWDGYSESKQEAILDKISMRRLGFGEDIANAVCFFASDASSWITGQTLSVDGGYHMY